MSSFFSSSSLLPPILTPLSISLFLSQSVPEAHGAVSCHPHHPAQRAELLEAAQLAMVASLHQGEAATAGHQCGRTEEGDGGGDQEAK